MQEKCKNKIENDEAFILSLSIYSGNENPMVDISEAESRLILS